MKISNKLNDLKLIFDQTSNVFLMAHKDLDLDAINSCIAMQYYLKENKKKSYIIIDDEKNELGVKKVLKKMGDKISIIKSKQVFNYIDMDSLLIILDTGKSKLTQCENIINSFDKIINIDHHDKNKENIKATLSIIDEDASSTCEIITELFKEKNLKIPKDIATLLLSGIALDTNHFRLKTTAMTFYYSYYLMMSNANNREIEELLKQDLNDYIKRQKIITSVKVMKNIAIGRAPQGSYYKREEIAKSADSLLTFSKIKASFVIAKLDENIIGISGRSNSDINVGEILEKFGGGGDEFEAAAKIENSSVKKVIEDLKKYIKNV